MDRYQFWTRRAPLFVARLSSPFVGWRRLVVLVVVWLVAASVMPSIAVQNLVFDLGMALALVVAASWLSLYLPWEDIDRFVLYAKRPRQERVALREFDKMWPTYMASAGLSRPSKAGDGATVVPPLYGLEFNERGQLVARPGLLMGQTVDDWQAAAEVLRTAVGALRLRVVVDGARNGVELVFSFADALDEGVDRALPDAGEEFPVDWAEMGFDEDGRPWLLPLRISTLFAGATGSGKGSMLWNLLLSQLTNISSGLVQVLGVDLKGGMELSLGAPLFTRLATEPAEAVVMLEEAAQECQARAKRMAGHVRSHTATLDEPMVMIVIDELAALVAYSTDRDLMRRAEAALAIILTQGRAVGFYVYGFLQDPRKEVLKIRNLFTQAVGLRLNGSEEAAMVLSHDAVRAGARCQDIPKSQPGTAYVLDETGQVTRVRAAYIPDEQIREAANAFPAPVQVPIVVPEPESKTTRRTSRIERSEAA